MLPANTLRESEVSYVVGLTTVTPSPLREVLRFASLDLHTLRKVQR